jgi:L-alanine-DL-glutamate epimerase-like enolase superfamily enzyme
MLSLRSTIERWPMKEPFEIARETMTKLPLLAIKLTDQNGVSGHAEAAGVDYDGETPPSMAAQIEAILQDLHTDIAGDALNCLLPSGGARNAVDCALWDLRAKRNGVPAWQSSGLAPLRPVLTAFTIGLGSAEETRQRARAARNMPLIKIKADGHRHIDIVDIVRDELPQVRLIIDANQAWDIHLLETLLPQLQAAGVELIEQPLPVHEDAVLARLRSPIPIAADESCTDCRSLIGLVDRYQAVNIKLDKCGGLTEALAMVGQARELGLDVMVGNMCGTSLGMAPAFLVAQLAKWTDLDGPLLQRGDRQFAMSYLDGVIQPPSSELWG